MTARLNPDMLVVAREAAGLSQQQLATKAGASQALISKMENGLHDPAAELLVRLADVLEVAPSLLQRSRQRESLPPAFYRKRATTRVRSVNEIEATLDLMRIGLAAFMRNLNIDAERPLPLLNVDEFDGDAVQIAQLARQAMRVPSGPIRNLVSVIEDAGVVVVPVDVDLKVDAVSYAGRGDIPPVIFYNAALPASKQRFAIAHELGHLIMHAHSTDGDIEIEADAFGRAFLMPPDEIRHELRALPFQALPALKMRWRVPMKALILHAHRLGVITPGRYKSMMVQFSQSGYGRREAAEFEPETPTLLDEIITGHQDVLGLEEHEIAAMAGLALARFRRLYRRPEPEGPRLRLVR